MLYRIHWSRKKALWLVWDIDENLVAEIPESIFILVPSSLVQDEPGPNGRAACFLECRGVLRDGGIHPISSPLDL